MFMHCNFATDCWKEANLWGKIESYMTLSGSFSSIIFDILGMFGAEYRARFVGILRSIWCARNACLWEQKLVNEHASCILSLDTVQDYMWCHCPNDDVQSATLAWSKPHAYWIKCNVDCALFKVDGKFGVISIGFRDSLGHLMQARSMVFPFVITAAKCEVTALQEAFQIALELSLIWVVFEPDCQIVVTTLLNNSSYVNEQGNLLSNCRTLLISNVSYALAYIRRQTNRVARNLARASRLHASPSSFLSTSILHSLYYF